MINVGTNHQEHQTLTALSLLVDTKEIRFYLTGSRFFGWAKPNSDWDFFTQHSYDANRLLMDNGFRNLTADLESADGIVYPEDPNIVSVWERGRVQVQLVENAELKAKAQELLNQNPIRFAFRGLKGGEARPWWKWAFAMAQKLNSSSV